MKRTYRYSNGEFIEVTRTVTRQHFVIPDCPDYTSPIDDRVVHGRRGRRYDLERSGSRPWEGMEQERKEENRRMEYAERESDRALDRAAQQAWAQLHPDMKKRLRDG